MSVEILPRDASLRSAALSLLGDSLKLRMVCNMLDKSQGGDCGGERDHRNQGAKITLIFLAASGAPLCVGDERTFAILAMGHGRNEGWQLARLLGRLGRRKAGLGLLLLVAGVRIGLRKRRGTHREQEGSDGRDQSEVWPLTHSSTRTSRNMPASM